MSEEPVLCKFQICKDMPGMAMIDCNDYPDVDPWSRKGRRRFKAIVTALHHHFNHLNHFIIWLGDERIGEIVFRPDRLQ